MADSVREDPGARGNVPADPLADGTALGFWDLWDPWFHQLLTPLAEAARSGRSPWFLPEALMAYHVDGDPSGLEAVGLTVGADGRPRPR
jgi:hypothetical protein